VGRVGKIPRAFRRRLLLTLLAFGLLPMIAVGAAGGFAFARFLAVSFEPLQTTLDDAADALEPQAPEPMRAEFARARLWVAQAELARSELAKVLPGTYAGLLALVAMLCVASAVALGRGLARPVGALALGIQRYASGDWAYQLPEKASTPRDELAYLVHEFNRMGRQLSAQAEQLRFSDKLAAGQLGARLLSHELKNPLTAMAMAVGRIERAGPPSASVAESLALLRLEIESLRRFAEGFAELGRLPEPAPESVDLSQVLEESSRLYQAQSPVAIVCHPSSRLWIFGDGPQLRHLFSNLIKNAVEASVKDGAPISVSTTLDGARVRVSIEDHGTGITDPLEGAALAAGVPSTKPSGSGLGLVIAHRIAADHSGALRLARNGHGGTTATVEFPMLEETR
jgi:two-component system nitrogen regulation sensor histidine kinase NtrY